jgi:mRNA interferase MazF
LSKKSIADCLQTRPVDYTKRFVKYRGAIAPEVLQQIDQALMLVFGL